MLGENIPTNTKFQEEIENRMAIEYLSQYPSGFFYLLNFVLLSGYAVESEKLLTATASGKQGVPKQVH